MAATTHRYAAFLRGMNLGRRRITNDELCAHLRDLGLTEVGAFLASGNVVFESSTGDPDAVAELVRSGLERALDYAVPTFVRTPDQIRAIAAHAPFPERQAGDGKVHVALLEATPEPDVAEELGDYATDDDRLALDAGELYWWRRGPFLESDLDLDTLETRLGPLTVRTQRTIKRLAAKFFSD